LAYQQEANIRSLAVEAGEELDAGDGEFAQVRVVVKKMSTPASAAVAR
jgi:hypothetical protein